MLDVAIFELFISPLTEPIMYTYVLYFYVFHCLHPSTHERNGLSRVWTSNKCGSKMEWKIGRNGFYRLDWQSSDKRKGAQTERLDYYFNL